MDEFIKRIRAKYGAATSAEVIRREIIREVIYKRAHELAVGTKIVGTQKLTDLEAEWVYPPTEILASYPVAEGAVPEISHIEWSRFSIKLQKAVVRLAITDEARLRDTGKLQIQISKEKASAALAKIKDDNIMGALVNGAFYSFAASAPWNDIGNAQAIVNDVAKAVGWIFENADDTTGNEKIAIVVPAKLKAYVSSVTEFNNISLTIIDVLKQTQNAELYFTRSEVLGDNALVLIPGEMTAIHAVLDTNKIPLVEEKRVEEAGLTEYIVRQYFNTALIPDSNKIVKITGVIA